MSGLDYRNILKQALALRTSHNPHYSLRAFARDLKVAPSHLSGILKGRLGLSRTSAFHIGKALGMSKNEVDAFVDLVELKHARSRVAKAMAKNRIRQRQRQNSPAAITLDRFRFVSDWYHLALLEMSYLKNFKPEINWIAEKLGLTPAAVGFALKRLYRLGLITYKSKTWRSKEDWSAVTGDVPSQAIRDFHTQLLKKAQWSLEFQSIENRDFRSTIMAIRKEKIQDAKLFLKKFHEDFCHSVGEGELMKYSKEEVYCLQTSFFPLTKINTLNKMDKD